jgi:hypothetical protein
MPTNITPYAQITGPATIYIAPYSGTSAEAAPDVDTTPAGNWAELGKTDGDQIVRWPQTINLHRDNSSPAARKASREEESKQIEITIVDLTLENLQYALGQATAVASDAGPPAVKTLKAKRGFDLDEFSLLIRGEAHSPYGDFPAQDYTPRCVVVSEPEMTLSKGRAEVTITFEALEDSGQSAGDELGFFVAQTA